MATTLTPMSATAGVTYCTTDGTPYRTDPNGVVYVKATHQTELTARGLAAVSTATLATKGHGGDPTTVQSENVKDHG